MSRSASLTLAVSVLFSVGCHRNADTSSESLDPNQVVATWSGGQFTRGEVEPRVARRAARFENTPEARAAALQKVLARRVRRQILYREAVAAGVPERPAVKATLRAVEDKTLAEDWLAKHVAHGVEASASQIEQEVQRLAGDAGKAGAQELRRFSHVFLRAPRSDAQARSKATARMAEIQRELADGGSFEELAAKYSDSITARGGGRVEWTPRAPLHDAVAEAVFSLSAEGQVSEPVETEMGLHLFRLDGIRRPVAPDLKMVREDVKRRFDAEAVEAAIAAEKDRAFDASGARVDAVALARPGTREQVLGSVGQWTLRREEFDWLREGFSVPEANRPPVEFARALLVNHALAERRRAEPIDADLQRKLDEARFLAVADVRKKELMAAIPTDVSAKEIAEFYEQYRDKAPVLRDHVIDLLFIPQTGPEAAEVYAKGEEVSRQLRDGRSFDSVLDEQARKPGVVVRRRLSAGDAPSLRSQSPRLGGTIGRLAVGEVSAPIYLEGETLRFTGRTPVISAKGLAFARLVDVRPQPLDAVRPRLREAIVRKKESDGIAAILKRLDEQAALKILVANP